METIHRRFLGILLFLMTIVVTSQAWTGSGTSSDPYQITSEEEWNQITTALDAYLLMSTTSGEAKRFDMRFIDDVPTSIQNTENGELRIENDDTWYDLSGRKISIVTLPKGIYIHNGRKVVIK